MLKLVKVLRTVDLHLKRLLPFCSFVRAVPHKKRRVHQKRGSCAARDYNFGFRPAGSIFSLSSPALSSLWRERQDPQVPRSVSGRVWQGEQEQHESHFHSKVVSYSFIHMGSVASDIKCVTQEAQLIASYRIMRGQKIKFTTLGASNWLIVNALVAWWPKLGLWKAKRSKVYKSGSLIVNSSMH